MCLVGYLLLSPNEIGVFFFVFWKVSFIVSVKSLVCLLISQQRFFIYFFGLLLEFICILLQIVGNDDEVVFFSTLTFRFLYQLVEFLNIPTHLWSFFLFVS